jgi:hypothetical protein
MKRQPMLILRECGENISSDILRAYAAGANRLQKAGKEEGNEPTRRY